MQDRKEELRRITNQINESQFMKQMISNNSRNQQYQSLNESPRNKSSQSNLHRIKNYKSNSSFIQNSSFKLHYPQNNFGIKAYQHQKQQISQTFQQSKEQTHFIAQSPIINPNKSIHSISQSYFMPSFQTNPSTPSNLNILSTGLSFNINQQTPQNKTLSMTHDQLSNIPKLDISKTNAQQFSKQIISTPNKVNVIQNNSQIKQIQQNNNIRQTSQQHIHSNQQSPLRNQEPKNIKFKAMSSQNINQPNNSQLFKQIKQTIFKKFSNTTKDSVQDQQRDKLNYEQDQNISNTQNGYQTQSSTLINGAIENIGSQSNTPSVFQSIQQQQIQQQSQQHHYKQFQQQIQKMQSSNQNNIQQQQNQQQKQQQSNNQSIQNNIINTQQFSKDVKNIQPQNSENDLFSTSRKENRMIELMKQKVQKNQLLDITLPKPSDKLISCNSYLTSKLNPYYEKTMNLVSDIENKRLGFGDDFNKNSSYLRYSYSKNNDSQDDNNYHFIEIKNKEAEPVELAYKQNCLNLIHAETLEFFYVYVSVKTMQTPVRVSFKTPVSKLKVFISKSTPYPSKFSNDFILQNNVIRVDDGGNKQFTFDKLYFGILSEIEQDIKISIKFGFERKNPPPPLNSLSKSGEQIDFQSSDYFKTKKKKRHISTPVLAQDVAEIKERRRRKMMRITKQGLEKDFCQENINYITSYTPDSHKNQFQEKLFQFKSKHKEVVEKKRVLDEQQYYKKDYLMKCREFQKQINYTFNAISEKKREVTKISNQWAKLILQIVGLQIFYKKIKRKSNMMKTIRDATIRLKLMINSMKNNLIKSSGTHDIQLRTMFDVKRTINLYSNNIKKQAKKKAGEIIADILVQRGEFYSFNTHLISYVKTKQLNQNNQNGNDYLSIQIYNTKIVNMIIARWREFKTKKENFIRMLGFLFDKYFSKVLESITKNGSEMGDFFSVITIARRIDKAKTETTRQKFIECYLERRRVEYTQDLLKYFQRIQSNHKLIYLSVLTKKRYEQEIDFNQNKFEDMNEDGEKEIEKFLFDQVIDKKRAESLGPPRFFVVPTYDVLKQVVYETFVKIKNEKLVKGLREEKIKKNWSDSTFLKKLIQNDDDFSAYKK